MSIGKASCPATFSDAPKKIAITNMKVQPRYDDLIMGKRSAQATRAEDVRMPARQGRDGVGTTLAWFTAAVRRGGTPKIFP